MEKRQDQPRWRFRLPRLPRLRAVMKWSGVTLCVLIFALWLVSGFRVVVLAKWNGRCLIQCSASAGVLWCAFRDNPYGRSPDPAEFAYWFAFPRKEPGWTWPIRPAVWATGGFTPLYLPFLLIALPTGFLFYSDRKVRSGLCAVCRYDLRGLPETTTRCPECGSMIVVSLERGE